MQDFLRQQSRAACTGDDMITPQQFWKQHAAKSLRDGWDYNQAQVDLIPHIPGDYPMERGSDEMFCYGRQRVHQILQRRSVTLPRLSSEDRILVQPTSLGADWNVENLSQVIQSYLPKSKVDMHDSILTRLDIVWPTDDWIQEIRQGNEPSPSPHTVDLSNVELEVTRQEHSSLFLSVSLQCSMYSCDHVETLYHKSSISFLVSISGTKKSDTFNRTDSSVLARMVQWEPTAQHTEASSPRVPHFKSAARLLHHRPSGVSEGFAWFILTSACLSQGAQGVEKAEPVVTGNRKRVVVSYRNFELGVLFCSRRAFPMSTESARIYCYKPTQCTCHNKNKQTRLRLVHLPVPFECRPLPYVDAPYGNDENGEEEEDPDEQVAHFVVSPYFHEIAPGTAAVSNMLLTPYGKAVLSRQNDY